MEVGTVQIDIEVPSLFWRLSILDWAKGTAETLTAP
jgi:hypothetical protein